MCSLGKHSVNLQSSFTGSVESFCPIPVKILARITLILLIVFDKIGVLQLRVFLSRSSINVEGFVLQFHIYFFSPPGILLKRHVVIFDFINLH